MVRKESGLTQQQLANAAGVTKATISSLELGTSKNPAATNLLPLARALHVDPEWLISGKGEKSPDPKETMIKAVTDFISEHPEDVDKIPHVLSAITDIAQLPGFARQAMDDVLGKAIKDQTKPPNDEIREAGTQYCANTPAEIALLQKYRQMTPEQQQALQTLGDAITQPAKKQANGN